MARRKVSLDEKIEKARETMFKYKAKYEAAQDELKVLLEKKSAEDLKEIMEAVKASPLSKDEILKLLAGEDGDDD